MDFQTRMQIEWACVAVSNAFAYHLDHKNYREVANLFTEDGAFVRNGQRLAGPAAILKTLEQRPATALTRHVTTGFHFMHVDETSARSVAYSRTYIGTQKGDEPASFGPDQVVLLDFYDTFKKTASGWRLAERHTKPVLLPDGLRAAFGLPKAP